MVFLRTRNFGGETRKKKEAERHRKKMAQAAIARHEIQQVVEDVRSGKKPSKPRKNPKGGRSVNTDGLSQSRDLVPLADADEAAKYLHMNIFFTNMAIACISPDFVRRRF